MPPFAAPEPGERAVTSGVRRVIKELFKCLRVNPDLDLKIVGGFAGDWNPMVTSLASRKWASTVVKSPVPSLAGYRTRSRLGELAAETLYRFQERLNRARGSKTFPAVLLRMRSLALAVLRRFAHSRVDWGLGEMKSMCFTRRSERNTRIGLRQLKAERDVVAAVSQFTKDDLGFLFLRPCSVGRPSFAPIAAPCRKLPVMRPS